MKGNDIKLIIVMVAAIIGSGLVAKKLVSMQTTMNRSTTTVSYVSKLPLAGFQKFMADITWMRFLNYAGNNQLTDKNVDRYEYYIQRILALDPDFEEVYQWGVLFLSQEDLDKALKIVDMAQQHPRFRSNHKLPLLGGQLLMRPQWMNMYSGKKVDLAVAKRAKEYYFIAKNASDANQTCLNSFIRVNAVLKDNGDPHEINELREWITFCKTNPFGDELGMSGLDMEGAEFMSEDLEKRLLSQIRYVSEKFIINDQAAPEAKAKAEAIVKETISEFFNSRPFDMETYMPYNVGSIDRYQGTIDAPVSGKKYVIELDSENPFAVESLTLRLGKGSAKVTVYIGDKPVKGLEAITVGTTKISAPGFKPIEVEKPAAKSGGEGTESLAIQPVRVRKSLLQNKGGKGSVIELLVTDCEGCDQLSYILSTYIGEY